jgi:hypothetical protein
MRGSPIFDVSPAMDAAVDFDGFRNVHVGASWDFRFDKLGKVRLPAENAGLLRWREILETSLRCDGSVSRFGASRSNRATATETGFTRVGHPKALTIASPYSSGTSIMRRTLLCVPTFLRSTSDP